MRVTGVGVDAELTGLLTSYGQRRISKTNCLDINQKIRSFITIRRGAVRYRHCRQVKAKISNITRKLGDIMTVSTIKSVITRAAFENIISLITKESIVLSIPDRIKRSLTTHIEIFNVSSQGRGDKS